MRLMLTSGSTDNEEEVVQQIAGSEPVLEQPTGTVFESDDQAKVLQSEATIQAIVKKAVLECLNGCGFAPGVRVGEAGSKSGTSEASLVVANHNLDGVNLDGNLEPDQVEVPEGNTGIGAMSPQRESDSHKVSPLTIPITNKGPSSECAPGNFWNGNNNALLEKLVFRGNLPEFSGLRKENASNWLAFVRQSINVLRIEDTRLKTVIAAGYLKGDALQWYLNFLGRREAIGFEEFCSEFTKAFIPKNQQELLRRQRDKLEQRTDLQYYLTTFRGLMNQIVEMSEFDRLHAFLRGLNKELSRAVRSKFPDNLEEAIMVAQELDYSYSEHREEQGKFEQQSGKSNQTFKSRDSKGTIICFKCNQPGHYADKCQARPTINRQREQVKVVGVTNQIRVTAQVGPLKLLRCLVDTGASSSYLHIKFVAQLREFLSEQTKCVTIAGGRSIKNLPTTTPLRVVAGENPCILPFGLIDTEDDDAILGMDWIKAAKFQLQNIELDGDSWEQHETTLKVLQEESDYVDDGCLEFNEDEFLNKNSGPLYMLVSKERDLFASSYKDIGTCTFRQHKILVKKSNPIFIPPYRKSWSERELLQNEVNKMLEAGVIRESNSPWSFPVVLVNKPNNEKRFCVDYRKLNEITIADQFPVPRIDDILDRLQKSRVFSTLDLKSGYWQVKLDSDSIPMTAFSTPDGHYEFLKLPFGIRNAPADFSRLMREIFGKLSFVEIYIDDITVHSKNLEEHIDVTEISLVSEMKQNRENDPSVKRS